MTKISETNEITSEARNYVNTTRNYIQEVENTLTIDKPITFKDKYNIISTLLELIDSVTYTENKVQINLNKTLIIKAPNTAIVADNLNIHLAGNRVELQPRISTSKKQQKLQ